MCQLQVGLSKTATMFLSKDAQTNVYTQAGETYLDPTKPTIFHLLS